MRLLFGLIILLGCNFSVYASSPYIEGHYNKVSPDTVSTQSKTATIGTYTFTGNENTLTQKDYSVFGFEIGVANLDIPNCDTGFFVNFCSNKLRIGYSYLKPHLKLKSSTINGSVTDGTTTLTGSMTPTPANWASLGISFDNDVELKMLNLYYDFNYNEVIKPFLGFGLGYADIQNTDGSEFATSFIGGAKYYLNKKSYLGAKFNWTTISGPTDKVFAIKYNDIDVFTSTIIIGFEF